MMERNWLDDYIRQRWILRYEVLTNTVPYLPDGAHKEKGAKGYAYVVSLANQDTFALFTARLKRDGQLFQAHVVYSTAWWVRLLEPTPDSSITMVWGGRVGKLVLGCILWSSIPLEGVWRLLRLVR